MIRYLSDVRLCLGKSYKFITIHLKHIRKMAFCLSFKREVRIQPKSRPIYKDSVDKISSFITDITLCVFYQNVTLILAAISCLMFFSQTQPSLAQSPQTSEGLPIPTFWLGTAPACNAGPSNCTAQSAYLSSGGSGDGQPCITGHKVICGTVPNGPGANESFQWTPSKYFNFEWIGTAPRCRPDAFSQCLSRGGTVFGYDSDGNGSRCFSGKKLLCGFPKFVSSPIGIGPAVMPSGDVIQSRSKWHLLEECPLKLALGEEGQEMLKVKIQNGLLIDSATGQPYTSLDYKNIPNISTLCVGSPPSAPLETLYVFDKSKQMYLVNVCKQPSRAMPIMNKDGTYSLLMLKRGTSLNGESCLESGVAQVVHSLITGHYVNVATREISGAVIGAGTIIVNKGVVNYIDNCSGHYQPSLARLFATMEYLIWNSVLISSFANCDTTSISGQ